MKKSLSIWLLTIVFAFTFSNVLYSQRGKGNYYSKGKAINCQFVDLNGDGICDNFIDANNDGRCDNCKSLGQGYGYNSNKQGRGLRQRNFVDANNDGICDNYQSKVFISHPSPNPFNTSTNFWVNIPKSGNVQITLNSLDGKVLNTIYNGILEQGLHKFTVEGKNLISGRYLIIVKYDGQNFSRQIHYIQ